MLQMSHPYNVTTVIPGGIAEMFYGNGEDEQIVAVQRKVCVLNIYVIRRSKKCRRNFEIRSIKYLEDLWIWCQMFVEDFEFGVPYSNYIEIYQKVPRF